MSVFMCVYIRTHSCTFRVCERGSYFEYLIFVNCYDLFFSEYPHAESFIVLLLIFFPFLITGAVDLNQKYLVYAS